MVKKKKQKTIEMHTNYNLHLDHLGQRPTRTKKKPKKTQRTIKSHSQRVTLKGFTNFTILISFMGSWFGQTENTPFHT